SGALSVPALAPGESAEVKLPTPPADGRGAETQWTVRAVLAAETAWGPHGHQVAWAQLRVAERTLARVAQPEGPERG
ncbi:DUF4981 domain-containing protein, partial [Clostridium perfringens]